MEDFLDNIQLSIYINKTRFINIINDTVNWSGYNMCNLSYEIQGDNDDIEKFMNIKFQYFYREEEREFNMLITINRILNGIIVIDKGEYPFTNDLYEWFISELEQMMFAWTTPSLTPF